jgi:peroxiredoxin
VKHFHPTILLLVLLAVLSGCSQQPTADLPVASLTVAQSAEPQRYEVRKVVAEEKPESTLEEATDAAVEEAPVAAAKKPSEATAEETSEDVEEAPAPSIPPVFLSTEHAALCRVQVGDHLPPIKLNQVAGGNVDLESLRGEQGTVVLFWHPDRWMSQTALGDLEREVVDSWPEKQVRVVGIAVKTSQAELRRVIEAAGAKFSQLLDDDGKAFDQVGMVNLPRVYVLNAAGEIVWFDLEYSESTRRELQSTLLFLTAEGVK